MPNEIDEAVTTLVRQKLGDVRLVRVIEHARANVPSARRRYFTHVLQAAEGEVSAFSKTSPGSFDSLAENEAFLAGTNFTVFRVPLFYGRAAQPGGSIATWEKVDGKIYDMSEAPPSVLGRLVRIAADLAGQTERASKSNPALASRATFVEQISDAVVHTLARLSKSGVDVSDIEEDAALYDKNEYRAFLRFEYMGKVLSHLDFGNGNVLYPQKREMPIVIDWDTLTFAPPGAMLRKFAELEEEKRQAAAALFARLLFKQGRKVEAHDVYFTMCASQALYFLSWGCRRGVPAGKKAANAFRRGFALMRVAQTSGWVPQILPEPHEA